jgi:hypothetical protein
MVAFDLLQRLIDSQWPQEVSSARGSLALADDAIGRDRTASLHAVRAPIASCELTIRGVVVACVQSAFGMSNLTDNQRTSVVARTYGVSARAIRVVMEKHHATGTAEASHPPGRLPTLTPAQMRGLKTCL